MKSLGECVGFSGGVGEAVYESSIYLICLTHEYKGSSMKRHD